MKKYLIYIPWIIIAVIQIFDKDDKYFYLQMAMLALVVVYAIVVLVKKMKKEI